MLRTIVIAMKQTETMSMGQITTDIQANIMSQREIWGAVIMNINTSAEFGMWEDWTQMSTQTIK